MVRKGNLAVFEGSSISETGEAPPTKIGVHASDINLYLHEFFEPIPINKFFDEPWTIYSPWSERENWLFLKVPVSPKKKEAKATKIGVTSISTCLNFF